VVSDYSSGFYKFNYDGQPTEISRRVIDFVKAIPRASYENIVGVYDGYDAVKWSVGSVTVDGVTYANCQMRYTISTQIWTIYDYAATGITALIRYDNGTTIEQIAGTSTGLVGKLDSGTTDFGASIYYEMIDRKRSFTELLSRVKNITGISVLGEKASGTLIQYQVDKERPNVWHDIGKLSDEYVTLFPNAGTIDFNIVTLRARGNSIGETLSIDGFELLTVQDKGFDKN